MVEGSNSYSKTPFVDISFSPTSPNLHQEVVAFVRTILPDWKDKEVHIKLFTDGLSNKLIGCYHGEHMSNETGVLVRINGVGSEKIIERENEIETYSLLPTIKGVKSSKLYAIFQNGICYEFQNGVPLNVSTISEPLIAKLIAQQMAKIHVLCQPSEPPKISSCETVTTKFFENYPTHFEDATKQKAFESLPKLSEIQSEIKKVLSILHKLSPQMVFCHNDLLLPNIIYDKSLNEIKFIDFEFAGFNFKCFDIGNHFAEYAGLDEIDYTRYPNKEYQMDWLRHYLEHVHFLQEEESTVSEIELNKLYIAVNISALAAHLLWGTWGVYQAGNSVIEYDYMGYAKIRFDEFYAKKDQFYSLLD